jgi:hypothetical protein
VLQHRHRTTRRDPGCPEGVIADRRQASVFCIAQVLGIINARRLCKSLSDVRGTVRPPFLRPVVVQTSAKRRNSCSARHYDQGAERLLLNCWSFADHTLALVCAATAT